MVLPLLWFIIKIMEHIQTYVVVFQFVAPPWHVFPKTSFSMKSWEITKHVFENKDVAVGRIFVATPGMWMGGGIKYVLEFIYICSYFLYCSNSCRPVYDPIWEKICLQTQFTIPWNGQYQVFSSIWQTAYQPLTWTRNNVYEMSKFQKHIFKFNKFNTSEFSFSYYYILYTCILYYYFLLSMFDSLSDNVWLILTDLKWFQMFFTIFCQYTRRTAT